MQMAKPIQLYLNTTYSRVCLGKYLSDMFPVKNGLNQGHALSSLLFDIPLEHALRRVKVNQDGLKLKGAY